MIANIAVDPNARGLKLAIAQSLQRSFIDEFDGDNFDHSELGFIGGASVNDMLGIGHAYVWKDGVMTDLGLFAGDDDGSAQAIKNLGQIVGASGRYLKYRCLPPTRPVLTHGPGS